MRKAIKVQEQDSLARIAVPAGLSINPEEWRATPPAIRRETMRAISELQRGISIEKDRILGRPKDSNDGFCAIQKMKQALALDETVSPERDALIDRFIALGERLQADEVEVEARRKLVEELAPYRELAASRGQTLGQMIEGYCRIEAALASDPIGGLFEIMEQIGADPVAIFSAALNGPSSAPEVHG